MGKIINYKVTNYEEAYLFACMKQSESNLARCYLSIKEHRDELLEALELIACCKVTNYEEAYLFACMKQSESNLARCYLSIKEHRDELLEVLELISCCDETGYVDGHGFIDMEDLKEKARQAIAKAKGE